MISTHFLLLAKELIIPTPIKFSNLNTHKKQKQLRVAEEGPCPSCPCVQTKSPWPMLFNDPPGR